MFVTLCNTTWLHVRSYEAGTVAGNSTGVWQELRLDRYMLQIVSEYRGSIWLLPLVIFCVFVRTLTWTRKHGTIWRNCVALWPNVTWMFTSAPDRSTCPGNLSASSSVVSMWEGLQDDIIRCSCVCVCVSGRRLMGNSTFDIKFWDETTLPCRHTSSRWVHLSDDDDVDDDDLTADEFTCPVSPQVLILEQADGRGVELRSYVLPNEPVDEKIPLERFLVPIETIERASGLLFVPNIMKRTSSLLAITDRWTTLPTMHCCRMYYSMLLRFYFFSRSGLYAEWTALPRILYCWMNYIQCSSWCHGGRSQKLMEQNIDSINWQLFVLFILTQQKDGSTSTF